MTVGEWWVRWFPVVDLAPSTLEAYAHEAYAEQYRRHVGPQFGWVRLGEVTALGLSQFARRLREQGLAPASVAVALSVIRDPHRDAVGRGMRYARDGSEREPATAPGAPLTALPLRP